MSSIIATVLGFVATLTSNAVSTFTIISAWDEPKCTDAML